MENHTLTALPAELQALSDYLGRLPDVLAALVFGSAAAGRLRPDSDLDIAVLFPAQAVPDALAAVELRERLTQFASRDVDLVVLNQAPPILAFQAIKNGRIIACHDQHAYQCYVMRLISEYADFKRIRRPITSGECMLDRDI